MPLTLDWGARSERLRTLHASLGAARSFLLAGTPMPVALGALEASQIAAWPTASVTPIPVTPVKGKSSASAALPPGATHVRLDFNLKVTIGAATASCLAFQQLFTVDAGGALLPAQYAIVDQLFKASTGSNPAPPGLAPGAARRVMLGACPLLAASPASVTINCEFLDVTELWWATWGMADQWGWLLDPDFHGHPELLRVLAWTSGCAPMLWFVALSSSALEGMRSSPRPGADIVFLRAQAGFNAFRYASDAAGFLQPRHADTTMFHLGRWLLGPLAETETAAKIVKTGRATKPFGVGHAGVRLRPGKMAPDPIEPKDPMDRIAQDVRCAFRPAGVHGALLRSLNPDIALLPLGFEAGKNEPYSAGGGYTALLRRGALREVIDSARALLWTRGALARTDTATPRFDRQIWLAANSAANRQLFACLNANSVEIDRIISMDATPRRDVLTPMGLPAVEARAKAGKTFRAVFVTTPNMWNNPAGQLDKTAYLDTEKKLLATGADILMLPPTAEFDDYWKYPPTASSNALMFEALRFWDGNGLAASKRFGTLKGDQWLWWHEWSVNGGRFDPLPSPAAGTAGPPPVPRIRSFFDDALQW